MGDRPDLGPWSPLGLADAIQLFANAPFRWWVSGGHALELHLDRSWRSHDDTDISLVRDDAPALAAHLPRWDIHVGAAGVLSPWSGGRPDPEQHENNLWARPGPDAPWALDLTMSDGDADDWIYRRDDRLRRPWGEAILSDRHGVPYLAPELQLLFKSKDPRPKDHVDAEVVIPELNASEAEVLRQWLPSDHPWRALLPPAPSVS